jgi:hypothetical protein
VACVEVSSCYFSRHLNENHVLKNNSPLGDNVWLVWKWVAFEKLNTLAEKCAE